ncbi:lysoplasmalogenase TMEM86A [Petromyzon marinus]|uniref:lysoplasmalogenase TMEM86A n=1 Tax=Petromyzon marinus TaxID=7757 RepID=UPI003F709B81
MVSPVTVVKSCGPRLVPFFKTTCIYFVLWLPASSASWFSTLIKCLPILCLCAFVAAHGMSLRAAVHSYARRILAGLVFSALGDACLVWEAYGYFEPGMLMFGTAHAFYLAAFGIQPLRARLGLVLGASGAAIYGLMFPCLPPGPMPALLAAYFSLIVAMMWRAAARVGRPWTWNRMCACVGAALFVASDLALAVDKFCTRLAAAPAFVMSTYYLAQMCIALSVVDCRDDDAAAAAAVAADKRGGAVEGGADSAPPPPPPSPCRRIGEDGSGARGGVHQRAALSAR